MTTLRKLRYLYLLLLLLISSCEPYEYKVLEGTSWQITDYTIDGTDSMATIIAFNLDDEFNLGERGGLGINMSLTVKDSPQNPNYGYDGVWNLAGKENNVFFIAIQSGPHVNKPSFKPFRSANWTTTKLIKQDMQLDLTLDNRKYYLRFKPYIQ